MEFKENFDEYWPYSKTDIWQEQDTRDVLISTPDIFEKVLYLNVSTLQGTPYIYEIKFEVY